MEKYDSWGGVDPPSERPPTKYIDVRGRKEHESIIKSAEKCKQLGLDQLYETIVYLNRWGNWLSCDEPIV